jgi:hypothetical protein
MSRRGSALKWFYTIVQFVMLAVSIPKVALFFHAYDATSMFGPLVMGVDVPSWAAGFAIDLCAAFTGWAALTRFEATRRRSGLVAPAIIIAACTGISLLANYEYAVLHTTGAYDAIPWATAVNPIVVAAPPFLVLLFIALVPSILAEPRIKTAAEIAAESAQDVALVEARARLSAAKAQANARVRAAQLGGLVNTAKATVAAVRGAEETNGDAQPPDGPDGSGGGGGLSHTYALGTDADTHAAALLDSGERAALRNDTGSRRSAGRGRGSARPLPLHKRVVAQGGMVRPADLAEALGIGETRTREMLKDALGVEHAGDTPTGRLEMHADDLLRVFRSRRSIAYRAHVATLEAALKRGRAPRESAADDRAPATGQPAHLRVLRPQGDAVADDRASLALAQE